MQHSEDDINNSISNFLGVNFHCLFKNFPVYIESDLQMYA